MPTGPDNIKSVITVTNKVCSLYSLYQIGSSKIYSLFQMADWVAESVLSKDDPRRRAAVIKHFINVAEVSSYAFIFYSSNEDL